MFSILGHIVSAATFPGVIIHELAHQLFCRYFKVPVYKVCYFRFGDPSGYVLHIKTKNFVHSVLIGIGPFFLNSILGAIVALPSAFRVVEFDGIASPLDAVLIWLGVSIAMHAAPSFGDLGLVWEAAVENKNSIFAKLILWPVTSHILCIIFETLDLFSPLYGICVCFALPKILVALLA